MDPSPLVSGLACALSQQPFLPLSRACLCVCCMQIDLSWNQIGSEGAKPLADALRFNGSVTKILVGGNSLRDEGTTILCDALRESTVSKVQELSLYNNGIGPDGAKAVAAMAAVVPSVTSVRSPAHPNRSSHVP